MIRTLLGGLCAVLALGGPAMADRLQDIADRGIVRLGVRASAPPFSYAGPDGSPQGLAVRLCKEVVKDIAQQLGRDRLGIEFITVSAKERFPALTEGRTDIHCGPASATLQRRETLDFSILYFVDGIAAAVRPGTYDTVFDTKSGTFGYLEGTTSRAVLEDLVQRNGMNVKLQGFASHVDGLNALAASGIDIYFGDQAILLFQIDHLGHGDAIAVMEDIFSFEPYALAMKRGEDRLHLAVDRALSGIYDRGQIYALILEELGSYPLPPEARAVYQIVGLPQ